MAFGGIYSDNPTKSFHTVDKVLVRVEGARVDAAFWSLASSPSTSSSSSLLVGGLMTKKGLWDGVWRNIFGQSDEEDEEYLYRALMLVEAVGLADQPAIGDSATDKETMSDDIDPPTWPLLGQYLATAYSPGWRPNDQEGSLGWRLEEYRLMRHFGA
jgi:hypothetical protein